VTIAGNLRTMGFADLLQWLSASNKTGVLVIDGATFTKKVHFRRGNVVAVASDNPREMLGYYLVGWGFCTEDDLQYIIEMQDHFRVMLGELAVKLGHLDTAQLDEVLRVKTEETIFDLILWDEGEFRFIEGELPERDFLDVDLPVSAFLFEGFRQRDERARMAKLVPDARHVPVPISVPDGLEPPGQRILASADGTRSIERIALECRMPEFEVIELVHRGVRDGWMRVRSPADSDTAVPGAAAAPWIDALHEIEDRFRRGRLLEGLKLLNTLEERVGDRPAAARVVDRMKRRLEETLDEESIDPGSTLEPTVTLEELVDLECDPAEGFVLSRITGRYTVQEVLSQLPGSPLLNRTIVHNLVRRGLVKVRAATAVRRYRTVHDVHHVADEEIDPFTD
jgi:hypothetical protein